MSINDDAPCWLEGIFFENSLGVPPLRRRRRRSRRQLGRLAGRASSFGRKSGEFINQAEKVISQMIFVAEIMNTLPLSPSLSLEGEGDRLRLKKGRVGKGFVPVSLLDRRP